MDHVNASRALTPLYRVFLFGRFRIEQRDTQGIYQALRPDRWDRQSPQRVMAYLLVTPGRHALRDILLDALCPDDDLEKAQAVLTQALSLVRRTLVDEQGVPLLLPRKANQQKPITLAGRERIWCDWDAFQDKLVQAQAKERQGGDALPLWEEAYALCQKEFLLEERYSDWCRSVRERTEGDQRLCLLHLAACYRKSGRSTDAERILRGYLSAHTLDQDVLCCLMEVLAEHGCIQEALNWYQRVKEALEEEGMDVAEQIQETARRLQTLPYGQSNNIHTDPQPVLLEQGDAMDRQQFLHGVGKIVGATLLMPPAILGPLDQEILTRFQRALKKPSTVDEHFLRYLEGRTENYWQDFCSVALPAQDLLSYVREHLQKILHLLEGPLLPSTRETLCSLASSTARLIGDLYFDMEEEGAERAFKKTAVLAAHEANDPVLEAVAWGRLSFAPFYSKNKNVQEALTYIQRARVLGQKGNTTVRGWLAAVEAEFQATLGQREACLRALNDAAYIEEPSLLKELYWQRYDQSLALGYRGICFSLLSQQGMPGGIEEAQEALKNALEVLDPAHAQRRTILLTDLAGTYVQQGKIAEACQEAIRSAQEIAQIQSSTNATRLLQLRTKLDRWTDTSYVQALDEHVSVLCTAEWYKEGL